MKKITKKGFTMVELVIVIAVVAILAAILIPTFISLSRKANQSVDTQLIVNLNRILATAEVSDGKNVTMYDALQDAFAGGYDVTKISPTDASSDILWDQETDRFLAVTKDGEEYKVVACDSASNYDNFQPGHTFWKIYTREIPTAENQTYSIYWAGEGDPDVTEFSVGFDMGDFTGVEEENDKAKTVEAEASYVEFTLKSGFTDGVIVRIPLGALKVEGNYAGVHVYGVLSKLTYAPNADGVLTVHAYVAELELGNTTNTAKLVSNGAQYHQEFDEINGLFTATGVKISHEVVLAEYERHYCNEKGECLFCEEGHQGEIPEPIDPSNPGGDTGNNPGDGGNGSNPGTTCKHTNKTTNVTKEANCTDAGMKETTCDNCHKVIKQEAIPALGHDWQVVSAAQEPTCEEHGHTAARKCSRCGATDNGSDLAPLLHDFDENGQCKRCKKYQNNLAVVELKQNNFGENATGISWGNIDKKSQSYIAKLTEDITVTDVEFCKILGLEEIYTFEYDFINGKWVQKAEAEEIPYYYMYAVDVDLNGYQLTVTSSGVYSQAVVTRGNLRFRSTENSSSNSANKNALTLSGYSGYGTVLCAYASNSAIILDGVTVNADYYPIGVGYETCSVTIKNSKMNLKKEIEMGAPYLQICVEKADGTTIENDTQLLTLTQNNKNEYKIYVISGDSKIYIDIDKYLLNGNDTCLLSYVGNGKTTTYDFIEEASKPTSLISIWVVAADKNVSNVSKLVTISNSSINMVD